MSGINVFIGNSVLPTSLTLGPTFLLSQTFAAGMVFA